MHDNRNRNKPKNQIGQKGESSFGKQSGRKGYNESESRPKKNAVKDEHESSRGEFQNKDHSHFAKNNGRQRYDSSRSMHSKHTSIDECESFTVEFHNSGNESEEFRSDILEGRNPVLEALKAGRSINKILISKGDKDGSIKLITALAHEKGIVIQYVERSFLDNISQTMAHQGVIANVAPKDYVEIDDILKVAEEKGEHPFIIILDEITDANNMGSILRTADAVGAHGVIIPKRRSVGLNSVVSKVSAGAMEHVPVARVTNIAKTIDSLKQKNIWVVGTDSSGKEAFYDTDLKGPMAVVVGSEGFGIGKLVLEKCDFVVNIPMKGKISSLNAAVAGAIIMYEIQRQRNRGI